MGLSTRRFWRCLSTSISRIMRRRRRGWGKIRIRKLHEHLAEELDLVMIYHNCFQIVLSLIIYHCSSNADYDCIFIFQENLIPSEWRTTLEKVGVRVMMNGETND